MSFSEFQLIQNLLKGLQELEDIVKQGKLFATVRKVMGHPRRALQHTLDLKVNSSVLPVFQFSIKCMYQIIGI